MLTGLAACTTRSVLPSREKIAAQFITIDTRRDTTLKMKDGLEIIIPANALAAPGNSARLEVREALDISTMIKGGLVTKSDGKLLSSGGMFKIAPASDTKVSINKPITVRVPAKKISAGMQLYDGVERDGVVNWENPRPLNDSAGEPNKLGEELYNTYCKDCHVPQNTDGTYPPMTSVGLALVDNDQKYRAKPLYGVIADWRYDTAAIFEFVRCKDRYLASGKMHLGCRYLSPHDVSICMGMSNGDLTAIFDFIESDGRKKHPIPEPATPCDSCEYYQYHLNNLKRLDTSDIAQEDFVTRTDTRTADTIPGDYKVTEAGTQNGKQAKASYYTVKIDNFGWKNVDEETRNMAMAAPSKLSVQVNGPSLPSMHIYLVIPQDKILSPGGLLSDGVSYGFYGTDSTVYLPQRAPAYIFAIAEDPDKKEFYFGHTSFVTDYTNNLSLQLQLSSPENFEKFIQQAGGATGLSAKVGTVSSSSPAGSNTNRLVRYYEEMVAKHCR